nr:LicD family protein [Fusobacterium gastrosuis]
MNVLVYGTFDHFHYGHKRLLDRARKYGENLYIGVCTDEFSLKKGKKPNFSYKERCEIVKKYPGVIKVFPQDSFEQKEEDIKKYGIDFLVSGDDWYGNNDHLKSFCEVIYLERTPNISSTSIRMNKKQIQEKLLKMMKEIDEVCTSNSIQYWLSAGSLLGAVRHRGFIPWDDDIDIVMPRKDFEKFKKISSDFLNKQYRIVDCGDKTDELYEEYLGPMMKVIDTNKEYYKDGKYVGVFIDINPLDRYSNNFFIRKLQEIPKILYCGKKKARQNLKDQKKFKKKLIFLISKFFIVFPDIVIEKIVHIVSHFLNKEKNKYYMHCSKVIFKGVFKEEEIFPLKKVKFEEALLFIPNHPENYLKSKYGDYMKIPDEENRKNHSVGE